MYMTSVVVVNPILLPFKPHNPNRLSLKLLVVLSLMVGSIKQAHLVVGTKRMIYKDVPNGVGILESVVLLPRMLVAIAIAVRIRVAGRIVRALVVIGTKIMNPLDVPIGGGIPVPMKRLRGMPVVIAPPSVKMHEVGKTMREPRVLGTKKMNPGVVHLGIGILDPKARMQEKPAVIASVKTRMDGKTIKTEVVIGMKRMTRRDVLPLVTMPVVEPRPSMPVVIAESRSFLSESLNNTYIH